MKLEGKRIAVIGAARSGLAVCKFLKSKNVDVYLFDIKEEENFEKDIIETVKKLGVNMFFGKDPILLLDKLDMLILSPGVSTDQDFVKRAKELNIEVMGEIELAYNFCKSKDIIAITGTNGKTTTTTLVGELLKAANKKVKVCGNIGKPFIECVEESSDEIYVLEISSFQLETIKNFKPKIAGILNITPDHLDRHKTMDEYIKAKMRIFENIDEESYSVINIDNPILNGLKNNIKGRKVFFSKFNSEGDYCVFTNYGKIYRKTLDKIEYIMDVADIFIPGEHNLENVLAAISCIIPYNIEADIIKQVLKVFKGVEHRIEFISEINGRKFYNDSKGTNTDASIKALNAFSSPIVLIAGGYDKGEDFNEFAKVIKERARYVILIGTTAEKIAQSLKNNGFDKYIFADTLKQAVEMAYEHSCENDVILLSPACASWDMFKNYEERGNLFKEYVFELEERD